MDEARLPILKLFQSPYYALGTAPSASTTIGITVTFMFHSFFTSLARCKYLCLFSFSLIYNLWSARTTKSTILQVPFVLLFCFFVFAFCFLLPFTRFGIIIIITPLEFFTSTLPDGFSLEFAWQQVSSSLQDSSKYSGRFQ